ncbi:MAG: restriction endonuclease subunit S [Pseudoalteromonas sp.]|uniref:restriction endonuclease subunit S n=1 Tax=Pseudoalteromonas sp. TaxID=53249 RepID=UPI00384F36B2
MNKLPVGWISTKFTEVLDVTGGTQPPKSQFTSEPAIGYIRLLQIRDFGKKPVPTYIPVSPKWRKCEKNDVLIGRYGASIGRICTSMEGVFNVALAKVITPDEIDKRFLKYYLSSDLFQKPLSMLSRSAQNGFNKKDLANFDFYIAPLNEQIRIADKLDSILAKVNKAQSRLDKIPAILKRFRQSVLVAATSGELTKEWREFNKVDKGSWQQVSIDELSSRAFDGPFGSKLKTADYTEFGVKVVRLENIGHLTFKGDKETFISEKKYQDLIKNTLEHNDILFSSFVDEEIRTCLFEARDNTYINKADCFCIRVSEEKISPKFLMYNLGCKHTFDKIKKQVHGVTRPRINLRFLKSFEVSVPTVEEQIRIVEIIDALFHKAAKVEAQFLETKSKLDRLTQSILAKAFRGELVSQSDKDESAEALLKRIKAESPKVKSNK